MKNYKIWCTYHMQDIPKEYNLYDNDNFKLFYNDVFDLKEDNINYLHDYLCELCTYYYVWKNNLKSDIVGFSHYSKHFKYIDYDLIKHLGFCSYLCTYTDLNSFIEDFMMKSECGFLNRSLFAYLKCKYNIDIFKYKNEHPYVFIAWHNMHLFKWDVFCDVCNFTFGFLDYLCPNESWKVKSNLDFIIKVKDGISSDLSECNDNWCWWPRMLSVWFESVIGLYLGIKYVNDKYGADKMIQNSQNNMQKYFIICEDEVQDIDILKTWLKKNFKSGITDYIIKSSFSYDEIHNEYEKNNDIRISNIINPFIYNLCVYKTNEEVNDKIDWFQNEGYSKISLHLNECIQCDDSFELQNGNYTIGIIDS